MTGQSPHPRIISAYAKERSATCQPSSSSHQRSNSLPLRQFVPERNNSRSTTPKPNRVTKECAEPSTGYAQVRSARYDRHPQQSSPETASITAVKSRETLRRNKGIVFESKLGVNDMSSIDERVIASWGTGRKECLRALLQAQTAPSSRVPDADRNREHKKRELGSDRPASTPIPGHRRGKGPDTSSDRSEVELSTPSASEFPLPPIIPSWRDYHDLGGSKYAEDIRLQSTAPLAIRKKNPNASLLVGTTRASGKLLGRQNSRRTIRQINKSPSAEVRNGRKDDGDAELLEERLTSGIKASFRATRCPPGIRGDPSNRF
jgi:hypothetical protein